MMYIDQIFLINTAIFHKQIRTVNFDFMATLTKFYENERKFENVPLT